MIFRYLTSSFFTDYVKDVLNEGSKKARAIAIEKIKKAKEIVGLIGNIY